MDFINPTNLDNYIEYVSIALDWPAEEHKKLYKLWMDCTESYEDNALTELGETVLGWRSVMRGGSMDKNWLPQMKTAVNKIKRQNFTLIDMDDPKKLDEVIRTIAPLGQIKKTSSDRDNYMVASKILNFIFPELFPKIDQAWIINVCLSGINALNIYDEKFYPSNRSSLEQYRKYLKFGADHQYDEQMLSKLNKEIGVHEAYAVAFEYCLLGSFKDEISAIKSKKSSHSRCSQH